MEDRAERIARCRQRADELRLYLRTLLTIPLDGERDLAFLRDQYEEVRLRLWALGREIAELEGGEVRVVN